MIFFELYVSLSDDRKPFPTKIKNNLISGFIFILLVLGNWLHDFSFFF